MRPPFMPSRNSLLRPRYAILKKASKQILILLFNLRASPRDARDGKAVMEIEERHLLINEIR